MVVLTAAVAAGGYYALRDGDPPRDQLPQVQLAQALAPRAGELPSPDFTARGMAQIPAGTAFVASEFAKQPPRGWNHLVLFVEGRLGSGDVDAASSTVLKYTKLFNLVILANVAQQQGRHYLESAAAGFSTKINNNDTVITLATEEKLGANLGFIGRSVFEPNELALKDLVQIARTPQALLFNAPTMMLYKNEHQMMMVRYLLWANPNTGELRTLVWQMENTEPGKSYALADNSFQSLKPGTVDDRVMNVKGDRFNFLGIPDKDAFAVVRLPQGKTVPFNQELAKLATAPSYTQESFNALLAAIDQALSAQR